MRKKIVWNYTKTYFSNKTKRILHSLKHLNRYGNIALSAGLSLVLIGSATGVLVGLFVGINKGEDKRALMQFVRAKPPSSYNWVVDFSNTTAIPASRAMSGLLRPRGEKFDNIKAIQTFLNSPNSREMKFEVGGRTFDLSNENDLQYLKKLVNGLVDAIPSDVPDNYGLVGLPSLKMLDKNGNEYTNKNADANKLALDGAKTLTVYEKNEYTSPSGLTNKKGTTYKFHLKDNFVWNDGVKVKATDFLYQLETLMDADPRTISMQKQKTKKVNGEKVKENQVETYVNNVVKAFENLPIWKNRKEKYSNAWTKYNEAYNNFLANQSLPLKKKLDLAYDALRTYLDDYLEYAKSFNEQFSTLDTIKNAFSNLSLKLIDNRINELNSTLNQFKTFLNTFNSPITNLKNNRFQKKSMEISKTYTLQNRHDTLNIFNNYVSNLDINESNINLKKSIISKINKLKEEDSALSKKYRKKGELMEKVASTYQDVFTQADAKSAILHTNLNVPLALFPIITEATSINDIDEGANAFIVPWISFSSAEIMKTCSSTNFDASATKWKGFDLKFADGNEYKMYNNMGELCQDFSIFHANSSNNEIVFEIKKDFPITWFFELLAGSVIFLPTRKDFMEKIAIDKHVSKQGEEGKLLNHILGTDYYTQTPEFYLGNGPFKIISLGATFKALKNEKWHSKDYVFPKSYTLKYNIQGADNAITLNFIRGTSGTINLSEQWYNEFKSKRSLADKIKIKITDSNTVVAWSINMFAPPFTNNYFRTPIGNKISWGESEDKKNPSKTIVKEYKLVDGVSCEAVDTNLYYPSLSVANYICGLPPRYKDFANAFRRFVAMSFDNGKGIALRGNHGKPNKFTFGSETLTVLGLAYDEIGQEYNKTIGIAMKYQNDNPINLSDSKYDETFKRDAKSNPLNVEDRKYLSIYGSDSYATPTSVKWRSARKVGLSLETVLNKLPSSNLVAPDLVTSKLTKLGYTPSYNFATNKKFWLQLKKMYPEYTKEKLSFFFPILPETHWIRTVVNDYWKSNIEAATNGGVTMNLHAMENYYSTAEAWGRKSGLKCGASNLNKEYSLFKDGQPKVNCFRNSFAMFFGWGYDFSDPKNVLSTFSKLVGYSAASFQTDYVPKHVIKYWKSNIEDIMNQELNEGLITNEQKTLYENQLNSHINALTRSNASNTFADSINDKPIKDENNHIVISLNAMSAYVRNRILAQYEAWRIREGFSVPFLNLTKDATASRFTNSFRYRSTIYRESAYNCDVPNADRTFERAYISKTGEKKKYKFVAPNCLDSKIISFLSQNKEVLGKGR